jgi:hypothetical protein
MPLLALIGSLAHAGSGLLGIDYIWTKDVR